jgi:DNA-binding CsgD family transcriptional regulator
MGAQVRPHWPNRLGPVPDEAFVGRSRELDGLKAAWRDAETGQRRVVFVGGEPGAGKSRLVATLARSCHDQGAAVTLGLCFAELGVPFQPFAEVLTHLLVDGGADTLDHLPDAIADALVPLTGPLVEQRPTASLRTPAADAEDRRRSFDAVVGALRLVSERTPLVVIFEDLHWASAPTVQLLAHLVRSTTSERLLILGTHRTTAPDRSAELGTTIAGLLRLDGTSRLDLGGLDTAAIAEFLVERGVGVDQARASAGLLARQTGGNPFLLRELWRHLEHHGGLTALDRQHLTVPRSMGDTLELRLRAMPAEVITDLELAAVIGDPGDSATLVAASDHDLDTTLAAIDAGVAAGIVELTSPADLTYRFVHDLARQALIARLTPAGRAALHARVARTLEAAPATVEHRSSRLAHHWTQAGLYDTEGRSGHWLIAAGREAERALAFEEAAAHFEEAANRLPPTDGRRPDLILSAAANAVLSGSFADGRRLYEMLADAEDPELVARAAIGYEDSCWRPGLPGDRAVELLSRATRMLAPDDPLRVRTLASLGRALGFIGRHDRGRAVGEHALDLARGHGDDRLLAIALQATLWSRGGIPEVAASSLERAREVGRLAEELDDWELLGQAATYRGALAYEAGLPNEWRQARSQLELARRRSAQPFYAYMAGCSDQAMAYLGGDFALAQRLADELLELGGAFGQDDTEGIYGLQTFMIRRATGQLDAVRGLITGEESPGQSYWGPGLLALYTELGLDDAARRLVDRLLGSDLGAERLTSQWGAVVVFLADAICALGDETAARRLLPYLEPHAGHNLSAGHFVASFGSADRYLGALGSLLGGHDAEAHFRAALTMDQAMGAPVHEAETLARYAEHLTSTDPRTAETHRAEAHALASRLGMATLAARTARPVPDQAGNGANRADGLTGRELEVLRCLACGASNREIAAELYIAENTVANHVRSIMQKTGSANRTQAALYAAAHDLLP